MSTQTIKQLAVAIAAGQDRIVRPHEVSVITGRSLASMWRDEKAGKFPPKIRIGANSVGYRLSDVRAWMDGLEVITSDNVKPCVPSSVKRGRKPKTATTRLAA